MDPFVEILSIGSGNVFKTRTIQEGGKNPVWNQSFDIPLQTFDEQFKFTCFDEDVLSNSFVGDAVLKA